MINGEIVVITKGHISDYLYQYGIIVKENVDSLKICSNKQLFVTFELNCSHKRRKRPVSG
ncbi:hypothetical protein OfM1_16810 [Lactovum odontotermitis]